MLGSAELVAGQNHGNPLGEKQRRKHIFDLSNADAINLGMIGGAFDAVVKPVIVVVAVSIVLAIGHVVLMVVGKRGPK